MIDDITARQLGRDAKRMYLSGCFRFAAYLGRSPDTATAEDIASLRAKGHPPLVGAYSRYRTIKPANAEVRSFRCRYPILLPRRSGKRAEL